MNEWAVILPVLGGVLALVGLILAFRAGRRRRLIETLPTSKTTGVFIGLVELSGAARAAEPLHSYLAQAACVHYQWSVEEHWSRTVTETYTDSKGRVQTRTRTESGWTTMAHGGEMIPFYIQDDCGAVLVRPQGAKIEPASMFEQTCGPTDPLYYGKGPPGAVANSTYRRRFVETGLPVGATLFLVGQARERQDVVAPEIAADAQAPMFLISTRAESQITRGMKWGSRVWAGLGLVAVVGCMIGRDVQMDLDPGLRIGWYLAMAVGYFMAGGLAWVWMIYNSLVDARQRVRQAWSLVDIQLKRRSDLIPNLVHSVQGFRDYESRLQTELAALRNQMNATPPGVAGPDHGAVAKTLALVVERYPQLRADEGFRALEKNLVDTEQRIALARSYFNEIATHFNTQIQIVPERFVATLGAMRPQTLMAANDFERAPVNMHLTPAA